MTRIIITITFLLLTKFGIAQENNSALSENKQSIKLSIANFPNDKGSFKVSLYQQEGFLQKPLFAKTSSIKDKKASVTFENIAQGEYAIVYYHDSNNNNNNLDFDEYRRPVEDYGNTGTMNMYGPPSFELSKFKVANENLNFDLKF